MLVAPFAGSQAVAQTHNLTGTVVDAQGIRLRVPPW